MNEAAFLNVVDKIADKLAEPATEILSAYAASGVTLLPKLIISGIVSLVALLASTAMVYRAFTEQDPSGAILGLLICGAILPISLTVFTGALTPFVLWLQNPKAYAIVTLMDKLF